MFKNIMKRTIISVALLLGFYPFPILAFSFSQDLQSDLPGIAFCLIVGLILWLCASFLKRVESAEKASGGKLSIIVGLILFGLLLICGK